MIDYGSLATKLFDIFSSLLWQLKNLFDSINFLIFFPILVVIIVVYILIRNW